MFSVALILLFAVTANARLTDEQCVQVHNKELPNDFLRGTWYDILEFRLFITPSFCSRCRSANYTTATQEEVDAFKQRWVGTELPFSFDTNMVWYEYNSAFPGALAGDTEVKFFVLHPGSPGSLDGGLPYMTIVHNKVNDDFVLRYRCLFSSSMVELISRKRYPTEEELNAAYEALPSDVRRLASQRICCGE